IRAVSATSAARLDIYGSGQGETPQQLADLIESLRVGDRIIRRGYDPLANERFRDASYSILSSRSEGQGLVLLESMAAGCIPIAYDVRYGPSDIITDGVNGFLVSPDDIDELTRTVKHVTSMSNAELDRMRHAAVERARDFMPDTIVQLWAEVIQNALDTKMPQNDEAVAAQLVRLHNGDTYFTIEATVTGFSSEVEWAAIAWTGRAKNLYGRVSAQITEGGNVTA